MATYYGTDRTELELHHAPERATDPRPTVTGAELLVHYSDGTTTGIKVEAAREAVLGYSVDPALDAQPGAGESRMLSFRRELALRFYDVAGWEALIPNPTAPWPAVLRPDSRHQRGGPH